MEKPVERRVEKNVYYENLIEEIVNVPVETIVEVPVEYIVEREYAVERVV